MPSPSPSGPSGRHPEPGSALAQEIDQAQGLLRDLDVTILVDVHGRLRASTPTPPVYLFGLIPYLRPPAETLLFDPFTRPRVEPDGARLRETKRAARHARYVAEAKAEHAAWRAALRERREADGETFPEVIDVAAAERERRTRRLRRCDRRREREAELARERGERLDQARERACESDRSEPRPPAPRLPSPPRIAPDDPPETQFVG